MKRVYSLIAALSLLNAGLCAQTFFDSFDDGSRDPAHWDDPTVWDGNGQLLEQNGRLEFSAGPSPENGISQQLTRYPSYDAAWQVEMVVSVDQSLFSENGEDGSVSIDIANSRSFDHTISFGYGAGVVEDLGGADPIAIVFAEGTDDSDPEGTFDYEEDMPAAIGVRATYDPNLRLFRVYYRTEIGPNAGDWTPWVAYTIDGSSIAGAHTLDWGMTSVDVFAIGIFGHSDLVAIPSGSAWADDFRFNLGSTAQSEVGQRFYDDFNDDTRDPVWRAPSVELGTPELTEVNHRLEFRASSDSGEQEARQFVSQPFWPQYDQAFEVKVEAHCLPAALSNLDQVGAVELLIEDDTGDGDILLSVGALVDQGARTQVLATSNSQVIPPNEDADRLEFGVLPEVVGLRVVWAPETRILSCYFDTDGDRTVETWDLFADYTLDGSGQGTTHVANWFMSPTDHFRIGLNGFSENTVVAPGEGYFENFSLINTPLLSGFNAWAAMIADEGMRGTDVDASGNGIPNLLQYMYGLEPMAIDTDVRLTIQMENGVPALIHGFNESAEDYQFGYQAKAAITDPWIWASADDATSIETFLSGGRTFRKLTLPPNPSKSFVRLGILMQR